MSKIKYDILLPKSQEQLENIFQSLLKSVKSKHIIIKILENYINLDVLSGILNKYQIQIEKFKRNQSLVILTDSFDYEKIPDFIPVAPTEEEALDIIDFEIIERDLSIPEN
jgi:hypothetical protein